MAKNNGQVGGDQLSEMEIVIPKKKVSFRTPAKFFKRNASTETDAERDDYDDTSTIATERTERSFTITDAVKELTYDGSYVIEMFYKEMQNATNNFLVESGIKESIDENHESVHETVESIVKTITEEPEENSPALEVGFDGNRHTIVATMSERRKGLLQSWNDSLGQQRDAERFVESVDFVSDDRQDAPTDSKTEHLSIEALLEWKDQVAEIKAVQKRRFKNLKSNKNMEEEESLYRL